jgi:hypothetical protein
MDIAENHPMEFHEILKRQGIPVNLLFTDDKIGVPLEGDTIPHVYFQGGDKCFGMQSTKN